jgi:hypothetical protein
MKSTELAAAKNKKGTEKNLQSAFLQCRPGNSGHAWDIVDGSALDMPEPRVQKGKLVFRRCVRCTTARVDQINTVGAVTWRRYRYPEGYKLEEKVSSPALRAELLRRINRFPSEMDLIRAIALGDVNA